jgi:Domain of unknown function (DUF4399)/Family of unknown function (DUF6130)
MQKTMVSALLTAALIAGTAAGVGAQAAKTGSKSKAKRPRVFFVEPKNGATVTSPVHMKFGIANYEIAPVPPGDVKESRPAVGHYHIGVDTTCLLPNTVIPKASPWVHFGDGKSEFDLQLPAGRHKVVLQLGDDLHKTIAGLCTTISVNVK